MAHASPEELSSFFLGLEQRLTRQLTLDREAIVGAIAGGPAPGLLAAPPLARAGPLVLLPDEPLEHACQLCGRAFEPLRMAIHQRVCAKLRQPPPASATLAQQRFDQVRQKAWAQLAALSSCGAACVSSEAYRGMWRAWIFWI